MTNLQKAEIYSRTVAGAALAQAKAASMRQRENAALHDAVAHLVSLPVPTKAARYD